MNAQYRQVRAENPQLINMVGAMATVIPIVISALIWFGVQILSPKDQIGAIKAELYAHAQLQSATEIAQNADIAALRDDLLIVLTLKCSDETVAKIRAKGQYAAAARCESLVKTGK